MNFNKLLNILFFSLPLTVNAQTQVTEYNSSVTAQGAVYSLPATALNVDVKALKTTYTPGEFARYAERYLHVQGVKREPEQNWEICELQITPIGVPDSLKMYTIKHKDKSSACNVQLTDRGVLAAINTEQKLNDVELPKGSRTHHARDGKRYLTGEMLEAASTAKIAELVAHEIFDIRDSKNAIRRGQVDSMPKDGASLRIVLDDLDAQEEALMQLFVGYTDTTVVYERYEVLPKEDVKNEVLFRFSTKLGFVDADDLAGAPYYISVIDKHSTSIPNEKDALKRKITGVVYNVPGTARVTLRNMTTTLYDKDLQFGQFGTVDMLNNALFNKDAATKVLINPVTGALLKVDNN